jgi:hypothetical protein
VRGREEDNREKGVVFLYCKPHTKKEGEGGGRERESA